MNAAFNTIIAAGDDERRNLFLTTAGRMGTAIQNVEKDFWVCWILDALFHGLDADSPRLLFKGGTSLSKAFGLISRFSEDIDVTVFRDDLGEGASVEDLEALSGNKRRVRLDAIKAACQAYINGPLLQQLGMLIGETMRDAAVPADRFRLEPDPADADNQSLLFWYPSVVAQPGDYIRSAVKIESGAKSALDPHVPATVKPYVDDDLPELDLAIPNVTTVEAARTFWDKDHYPSRPPPLARPPRRAPARGQRVSRHHYDVARLIQTKDAEAWLADHQLALDCARHARLFFNSADLDLADAAPGTLTLSPTAAMRDALARDYEAMAGMIFGTVPPFDRMLADIAALEARINETKTV